MKRKKKRKKHLKKKKIKTIQNCVCSGAYIFASACIWG